MYHLFFTDLVVTNISNTGWNSLRQMMSGWLGTIFTDNGARWTPVPDDPISVERGVPPNSQRPSFPAPDPNELYLKEYMDPDNYMRRSTKDHGCSSEGLLGTTYAYEMNGGDPNGPEEDYHTPRQVIDVCLSRNQMKADANMWLLIRAWLPAMWSYVQFWQISIHYPDTWRHYSCRMENHGFKFLECHTNGCFAVSSELLRTTETTWHVPTSISWPSSSSLFSLFGVRLRFPTSSSLS